MELLEREADLELLDSALNDAGRGEGSIVLISGEAGIGKARITQAKQLDIEAEICKRTMPPFLPCAKSATRSSIKWRPASSPN